MTMFLKTKGALEGLEEGLLDFKDKVALCSLTNGSRIEDVSSWLGVSKQRVVQRRNLALQKLVEELTRRVE